MDEAKTIEEYVAAVREALGDVPARARDEALADLEAHLRAEAERHGEAAAIESVGWPHAYAEAIRAAIAGEPYDGPIPQGRILGMPYDFRGANTDRVAERMWNPADPRIFMPRLFGIGWTVNFGAIAVKLGLIRPDDTEDEAFERAPGAAVAAALVIPALLAVGTLVAIALSWTSLPAEVPVHWGPGGAPDGWAPKVLAFGFLVALTVVPVAITYARVLRPGASPRSRIFSAAVLVLLSALGLGIALVTIADADGGSSGSWIWAVIVVGLVLSFLLFYVPVRLGLSAEWRDSLGEKKE